MRHEVHDKIALKFTIRMTTHAKWNDDIAELSKMVQQQSKIKQNQIRCDVIFFKVQCFQRNERKLTTVYFNLSTEIQVHFCFLMMMTKKNIQLQTVLTNVFNNKKNYMKTNKIYIKILVNTSESHVFSFTFPLFDLGNLKAKRKIIAW